MGKGGCAAPLLTVGQVAFQDVPGGASKHGI
jgi:hypothetical protein